MNRLHINRIPVIVTCLAFVFAATACSGDDDSSAKPATDGGAVDGGVDAGSSADSSAAADAGSGSASDAGTASGSDTGSGAASDAGSSSATDAGSGSNADAGSSADAGSAADAGSTMPKPPFNDYKLKIAGVWESNFGGNESISDTEWATPFGAGKVVKFDNGKRYLITQNSKDDKYNPSKFNKIVWKEGPASKDFWQPRSFWYCWVAFGKDTADLAEASTATADDKTPDKSGCGKAPWTRVTSIETLGDWKTPFGAEGINVQAWGFNWVRAFENKKNWAITQNPADSKYGPNTFNKVVWTEAKDGAWYHCTVDFGLKTLKDAKNTSKTADDKDPAKSGCGNFAWTKMSKK